jgi:hypothetical protein
MRQFLKKKIINLFRARFLSLQGAYALAMIIVINGNLAPLTINPGQSAAQWSPQQQIPGVNQSTNTPILVTGRDQMVHSFASQIYYDNTGKTRSGIFYSQWSIQRGWTKTYDIFLASGKSTILVSDVKLDKYDILHLIYTSGDSTQAGIFYSKVPADKAYDATAWSDPILVGDLAMINAGASLGIDLNGYFFLLYTGFRNGPGVYATTSKDNGENWTRPTPIYLVNNSLLIPFGVQISIGSSGKINAVWNVSTSGGQGRSVFYSQLLPGAAYWSFPQELASTPTGLGTSSPNIIELANDELFVVYYAPPKIVMRHSTDGGITWDSPNTIFARHVGVNGTLALVTDGNKVLHLFFGQRISGNPDIHGMWHSTWSGNNWTEPDPVISGPRVMNGAASFDPFNARAVVIQGNIILVAWRTDPGNGAENENGVWYSYLTTNAAVIPDPEKLNTPTTVPIAIIPPVNSPKLTPLQTVSPKPTTEPVSIGNTGANSSNNTVFALFISVIPVAMLIVFVSVRNFSGARRNN